MRMPGASARIPLPPPPDGKPPIRLPIGTSPEQADPNQQPPMPEEEDPRLAELKRRGLM
jgi:hypothetical protein